LTCLL